MCNQKDNLEGKRANVLQNWLALASLKRQEKQCVATDYFWWEFAVVYVASYELQAQ